MSGRENPSLESKAKTTKKKMRKKKSLVLDSLLLDVLLLKLHNPFLFLSLLQVHFSFCLKQRKIEMDIRCSLNPLSFLLYSFFFVSTTFACEVNAFFSVPTNDIWSQEMSEKRLELMKNT